MSVLTQVRQGICDNITAALGAEVINTYPGPVGSPTSPAAWVLRDETEFHQTFNDGLDKMRLVVQVMVALADGLDSQALLDDFVDEDGPLSIKAAIETADGLTGQTTLGGIIGDLAVMSVGRDELMVIAGQGASAQFLATEFTVEVYLKGT